MNIVLQDTIRSIPLTQGLFALVSECDYERLSGYNWYAKSDRHNWYAARTGTDGRTIRMHVEILGKLDGYLTDHRNGNGLDNRRCNLRHCTPSQNMANQRTQKRKKTSKFKGVSYRKDYKKWSAKINIQGKSIWLGSFETEIEAAQAYDLAAIENFGTFARINEYAYEELESGLI